MQNTSVWPEDLAPEIRAQLEDAARHRAYFQVLLAHIDRLNDPDEGDPLERVVQDLTGAYERVAAADTPMQRMRTYYSFHGLEPWLAPGTQVWADEQVEGQPALTRYVVQSTFVSPDNRVHCVLESPVVRSGYHYVVRPVLSLRSASNAPTFFDLAMRNPKFAQEFGHNKVSGEPPAFQTVPRRRVPHLGKP